MVHQIQIMPELEFWPLDLRTHVLKGAPKGCGIRAYEKLAASHTRVLKKVSDLVPSYDDGGDSNSGNADSNDKSNATFSTVLKIVEYSVKLHLQKLQLLEHLNMLKLKGILLSMHITHIVI